MNLLFLKHNKFIQPGIDETKANMSYGRGPPPPGMRPPPGSMRPPPPPMMGAPPMSRGHGIGPPPVGPPPTGRHPAGPPPPGMHSGGNAPPPTTGMPTFYSVASSTSRGAPSQPQPPVAGGVGPPPPAGPLRYSVLLLLLYFRNHMFAYFCSIFCPWRMCRVLYVVCTFMV